MVARRNATRSCRRNGRSCQNSIFERRHAEARPVGRARNVAWILGGHGLHRLLQSLAALQRPRLLRGPGAVAAAARAGGEIGVRLRIADRGDEAANAHLAPQALPMEVERRRLRRQQFLALGALEVGVEHEAAACLIHRIETLEQHDAHVGHARGIDGRQREGVGIVRLVRLGLLEPSLNSANGSGAAAKSPACGPV